MVEGISLIWAIPSYTQGHAVLGLRSRGVDSRIAWAA